jgi:glyoxylase-like metal-dependent hydrolase (beta-lactamase superfamily II)
MGMHLAAFAAGCTFARVTALADVRWIHGTPRRGRLEDPLIQVHRHDDDTVLMRQSKSTSFEAPFLFLLLGRERALLLDTGATKDVERFPLGRVVDSLLDEWLAANPDVDASAYELVVAHTHGHGDHVAGDDQLADRPRTTVVSRELDAVQQFFGFTDWPAQVVPFDLGGRVLEVTGIPGHHRASIAVHDPATGLLLTGDTVYPGRLSVEDPPAFLDSLDRLVAFAATRDVSHVLGCHVEMTSTPGRDYPLGTTYQPHEARWPMTVEQLHAVRDAARSLSGRPGAHMYADFAIWNGPCRSAVARQLVRALGNRLRPRR